jgi:hypothetical protein
MLIYPTFAINESNLDCSLPGAVCRKALLPLVRFAISWYLASCARLVVVRDAVVEKPKAFRSFSRKYQVFSALLVEGCKFHRSARGYPKLRNLGCWHISHTAQ